MDERTARLAEILVMYSLKVRPGDKVAISGSTYAEPLMIAAAENVLLAGGHPLLNPQFDGWSSLFYRQASDEQLAFISPVQRAVLEEFDCWINLKSSVNTREMEGVDPKRLAVHAQAMRPLHDRYRERSGTGELRWVISVYPTPGMAQDAEMSLREYEDFVYAATFADQPDPVAAWKAVHDRQQRLVDWLEGRQEVHAVGPNVDFKLSIADRRFKNSDGDRNMPSGEIFTSPVEDSVEGWYRGSFPALNRGQEVLDLQLRFENGKVVEAQAEKNEGFLHQMLALDEGSSRLGEFAIGTNAGIQRFTRNILFDEKIGGTMHVALGGGFPELGGQNKSSLHWDIITDMKDGGRIFVDGELFYDSGQFKVVDPG
ncbi:MAG: aminopeptidase [Anaerolineales bacterium]|jgi:aminopeptidase